jgi:hypothetical protein
VTTVYSNSIEIEWNQAGLMDSFTYKIKYRLYKNKQLNNINELQSDYNNIESSSNEEEDYYAQSNDYYDLNNQYDDTDDNFNVIDTNSTKYKIGNSNSPLKPYTFYEFKVVVSNLIGQTKETNSLVVRTAASSIFFII